MDAEFRWVDGSPEDLQDRLDRLAEELVDQLESAARDIDVRIRGAADENAPVDRGRLGSSLESAVRVEGGTVRMVVGTNLEYARPMEEGADPFMPPVSELRGWAHRVLGDADAAFGVAMSIAENGLEERRYLRDAFEDNLDWALRRLNRAVERAFEEVGLA